PVIFFCIMPRRHHNHPRRCRQRFSSCFRLPIMLGMGLSAEVYLQLIDALKSEPRRGREQRAGVRVGVGASLKIQLTATKSPPLDVRVRDLSVDGIGIVAPRKLAVSEQFVVALSREGQGDLLLTCQ